MATHGIGKDRKAIGINMSRQMSAELDKRAASMRLSTSKYCNVILAEWLESGKKLKLQEG